MLNIFTMTNVPRRFGPGNASGVLVHLCPENNAPTTCQRPTTRGRIIIKDTF